MSEGLLPRWPWNYQGPIRRVLRATAARLHDGIPGATRDLYGLVTINKEATNSAVNMLWL